MLDACRHIICVKLQKELKHIAKQHLQLFASQIYPLDHSSNIYERILNSLIHRLQASTAKGISDSQIVAEIVSKSKQIGAELNQAIEKLLEGNLMEYVKEAIASKLKIATKKQTLLLSNSQSTTQTVKKTVKPQSTLKNNIEHIANMQPQICLCNQRAEQSGLQSFKCVHCGYYFHKQCNGPKYVDQTNSCLKCHLKLMYPNKPIKKVLLLGKLGRSYTKHQFSYCLDQQREKGIKMEIRCIRLKYQTNFYNLFPDIAKVDINGRPVKQMLALHKLSSVKFRKDEPITLHQYTNFGQSCTITISEQCDLKQLKESRIQPTDHLIGIFLISETPIHTLQQQIQENSLNTFQESAKILSSLFRGKGTTEDVVLQSLQITVACPLTTQRIKIAARGQNCKHFQCFDLHNYLLITAYSAHPKWTCPICKKISFIIRLDCILNAIIAQNSSRSSFQEVRFYPNGDYCVVGERQQVRELRNIKDLDVCGVLKRRGEEWGQGKGKGKREVICLD